MKSKVFPFVVHTPSVQAIGAFADRGSAEKFIELVRKHNEYKMDLEIIDQSKDIEQDSASLAIAHSFSEIILSIANDSPQEQDLNELENSR